MDDIDDEPAAAAEGPPQTAEGDPLAAQQMMMCGYLMKRSTKGEWHKRYFETSGNHLVYYKNIQMHKMLAAIALRQCGVIKVLVDSEVKAGGQTRRIQSGCLFSLDLQDRQLVLRADSLQSAEKWVECLTAIRDGKECALSPTHRTTNELLNAFGSESALSDASRISTAHSVNESGSEYTLGPLLKPPTARLKKNNQRNRLFCYCC